MSVPFSTLISYTFPSPPSNSRTASNIRTVNQFHPVALAYEQALNIGESYGERQQVKPVPCITDKQLTRRRNLFVE